MTRLPIDAPYDAYDDAPKDGNVMAHPLSGVFAVDLTAAVATCTGCGSAEPVARLRVYGRGHGLIACCPDCVHVVLRLVRGPGTAWLDLRGTVSLRIPLSGS
ncbi:MULTISPECIES: DUF6510 family protein [unclassified Streptomyces]|uniref:DUF6510 family protein n=1 Tax=unclassified Streptomyces TaxID=2593676 RepID=UPI0029A03C84|nr:MULTISPECIES: DUF6510 family protein [unclassified Streptomyces]MDX3772323.1 DUF6510 family protein [Streptomyces sp. AK08-01B]MDX3821825.1 DUF6510 family protein [Streptomyces sp. AK08-01A]